ncbi:bifunctional 4-hydroxy-2-oxoglutarate aldolase/2-dehydro-3-deoxy-phosphogluconate aldolase [Romeria aff. gracilis LEGE 07310]|uniref:Bifunctional 4-hydroxy-2-oxoglutarate aldolase/2-dehydro-3-deoxy-phosphogluconate aldolase n=1 Tax=Vasconcelosia minhoensis LEGE 07310 TaxID=915328 RepID=A0A8J7ATB2_9CYAN|nr:bifunctional 4-hydroxy-2-oxoglutarate aldolase/2-dehydro-3-deoxy-phosphogluconate aldolase [Romeria gracilis]MBE9079494.1 bifunctional 4-hydroxy-2-oxoglutarate aldolase/2-dehydro-3-deoxy-phosphogluconate aldolase [Romeria aff. gracilis LEGE 07310]
MPLRQQADRLDGWLALLRQHRAVAIIRAPSLETGLQMAWAAAAGGLRLLEVAWSGAQSAALVQQLSAQLPDCTVGLGTLLGAADLRAGVAAGGRFGFSPHTHAGLIQTAEECGIPLVAGAMTPTEIVTAWQLGAAGVKVFPVSALGGPAYVRALQEPLGAIPLIPTGGVTVDNAPELLRAGAIAVGLSGGLFHPSDLTQGDWAAVTARSRLLVARCSAAELEGLHK